MPLKVDKLIAGSVDTDSLNINGGSLGLPYKVYTALITQTGTTDPTAVVLDNTLGGELVWTRASKGNYVGTLLNAFPNADKLYFSLGYGAKSIEAFEWASTDTISILTGTPSDNELSNTPIEIRVYP